MPLPDATVTALRAVVPDGVLVPGDDGFAEARAAAIWNGSVTRQPAALVRPRSTDEVAAVVRVARAHGQDLTVRGGGHGMAGLAVAEDVLLLDLSRIAEVVVEAEARRVRCGGGTPWAAVDAATAEHGLAVTGGTISHTGVAGLTLGGGMGWLTRRLGLACDNLVSAEVVTADGAVVTASEAENPDLFWALRGGGGNFGVVTAFEFRLHEVPPLADLGLFFWEPQDAAAPLRFIDDYVHRLPREVGVLVAALSAPLAPFVPEHLQGRPGFAVLVAAWGEPQRHAEAVAPLRELGPAFELVTPIPYTALQQMFDADQEWGVHAYEKGLYLDSLTDEVIATLADRLPRKACAASFVPMFPLGGAYADVADDATAFGGARRPQWAVSAVATARDREGFEADRAWVRDLWEGLRGSAVDGGGYINFLADPDDGRVRAAYGDKYDRLAAVKAAWDPDNVFHHNANIAPLPGGALPKPRAAAEETARA